MPMLDDFQSERLRRVLAIAALALLVVGLFSIISPFLSSIAWALVLVMSTWPIFEVLDRRLRGRRHVSAMIATLVLAAVIFIPFGLVVRIASEEAIGAVRKLDAWLAGPSPQIPDVITQIPTVGPLIQQWFAEWQSQHAAGDSVLKTLNADLLSAAGNVGQLLARGLLSAVLCLFTCFVLYRDGERLASSFKRGAVRLGGQRIESLLETTRETVRGAVYGMVFTAVVQGILAGLGYWIAGVPVPLLLAGVTTIASFIPFGPFLVYTPATLALLASGAPWWHAALLFGYCVGVVSSIDNIIRPVFLSKATQMPLVLVVFSIFGGLAAFGMLGLFVGPVIMAIAQALWMEWSTDQEVKSQPTV